MSGHHHHGHCHHHHEGTAKAIFVSLAVNIMLTLLKWMAFLFTWSPSLFGEAAHSTADSLNPLLLWFGFRRSRKPKDKDHPLGHGREAFFWSLMAAQMMFIVGCVATAFHGVRSIVTGHVPVISWWAGGIMLFALVAEGYSLIVAWSNIKSADKEKRASASDAVRSKNPIVQALVLENGADMLGVLLAVCGYGLYLLTGNPIWDGIFSLAIAALLACSSTFLIRRNMSLITGETADEQTHKNITETLKGIPTVMEIQEVVATMVGPEEVKCRVHVHLNYDALYQEFYNDEDLAEKTEPDRAPHPQIIISWTVNRMKKEKRLLAQTLIEKIDEVVEVEIDCH